MKRYTQLMESATSADVNPGNKLGVTNHYTPIENILTNVRNLYCAKMGIVAAPGEDGVSIKLHSTKFVNKESIMRSLNDPTIVDNYTSLYKYITQQGLDKMTLVNLGMYFVVYFTPSDVATSAIPVQAEAPVAAIPASCPELGAMSESFIDDFEFETIYAHQINEDDDDVEVEDETHKTIVEIINSKDKVKAAKKLEALIGKEMELPREFYFAAVKAKSGEESIALRWKYSKKVAHGQSTEITKSLINIFGFGKDGIWVGDYDKDTMFQLPDEVKTMIDNVLEILGAEKTNDPAVFELNEKPGKKEDEKEDTSKDDENKGDEKKEEMNNDATNTQADNGEESEDDTFPSRSEDDEDDKQAN